MEFDSSTPPQLVYIHPLEPIHSRNKHILVEKYKDVFDLEYVEERVYFDNGWTPENVFELTEEGDKNDVDKVYRYDMAIVVGDSPGDFEVVRTRDYFAVMKIGFAKDLGEYLLGKCRPDKISVFL